jgi:hypothetical protein
MSVLQPILVATCVAGIGMLVALARWRWTEGVIWLAALIATSIVGVLLLQSWNRVMLKVDADHRAKQAAAAATTPTTTPTDAAPLMTFTVEHVFYIKPPVDRVIVVGTIADGTVRVGDHLVVRTKAGPVAVSVENIESIRQGDLTQASKGQQVGLRLTGVRKDQVIAGDRVTAAGRG